MKSQHPDLASGRWRKFSLFEQMANIGSEVERHNYFYPFNYAARPRVGKY